MNATTVNKNHIKGASSSAVFRVHHFRRPYGDPEFRPAYSLPGRECDAAGGDSRESRPPSCAPPGLHYRPLRCHLRRRRHPHPPCLESRSRPLCVGRGRARPRRCTGSVVCACVYVCAVCACVVCVALLVIWCVVISVVWFGVSVWLWGVPFCILACIFAF